MKKIVNITWLGIVGLFMVFSSVNAFVTNQEANIVVGQASMTSNTSGTSANKMANPTGIYCDDNNLYVADMSNNRVLVFGSIPTSNGANANWVLGQPNMNEGTANNGGVGLTTLFNPKSVCSDGTKVIVADSGNNRVLIYNTVPTANGVAADVVIGQTDGTSNLPNRGSTCSSNTLNQPTAVCLYNGKLFIADTGNNRVLIYDAIPTSHGTAASVVVGQSDFSSSGSLCAQNRMYAPNGVWVDAGKIFISDTGNNRVLVFNSIPSTNNSDADYVLGQATFSTNSAGHSQQGLYATIKLFAADDKLYVGDTLNHRVVIFDTSSLADNQPAETVIGQIGFDQWSSGVSATKLSNPSGVCIYAEKLLVADYGNHRVLIFDDGFADVTQVYPNHGVHDKTVEVTLSGKSVHNITGAKLVNGAESMTAFNFNHIDNNKLTCLFSLTGNPGRYTLEVNVGSIVNQYKNTFLLLNQNDTNFDWRVAAIGEIPVPSIAGIYYGIVVADNDNDGQQEITVAGRYTQLTNFNYFTDHWSQDFIPANPTGNYFSSIVVGDPDNDKKNDVYAVAINGSYNISQYVFPGWTGTTIGNGNEKLYDLAYGDGDNDGLINLYVGCDNGELYQLTYDAGWGQTTVTAFGSRINAVVVGDGNSDNDYEVYSANANYHIYQYVYNGTAWETTDIGSGAGEMQGVAVGDGNRDSQMEVYGTNKDGKVYQFKWVVSSWDKIEVADFGIGLNDVKVNDADNDGQDEIYVTTDDGRLFQCSYANSQWSGLEIGNVGSNIYKIAIGDGDNDNSFEIYGIAADNNVYQFKTWSAPTPTPTATVTATPMALDGFDGRIISKRYIYAAPNPIRGTVAKLHYILKEPASVEMKIFTTSNQLVVSYNMDHFNSGHFVKEWPCANISNGVYLMMITATSKVDGTKERVIKKIALVK
ncbi:NHL repeat-containing protein [bacterium]|nr:NHL repeat-containing protein [bacterium]